MKVSIITLFPELFKPLTGTSILAKAQSEGRLEVNLVNLRNFGLGAHKQVDDRVYGGGVGMILKVEPIDLALKSLGKGRKVLLTPQGESLTQEKIKNLAKEKHLILVSGKYEGVDERVRGLVDEEISIGDYVLSGGEIPAMVVLDAVSRVLPGVLDEEATEKESFSQNLLEPPQYTRPEKYSPVTKGLLDRLRRRSKEMKVPKVLLSGNHAEIENWRRQEAIKKTKKRRPDLLEGKN